MLTNLIALRKKKKYTQQQIADKLNISRTTYAAYELGTINIPFEKVIKLKSILKYKKDDIFFENKCQ